MSLQERLSSACRAFWSAWVQSGQSSDESSECPRGLPIEIYDGAGESETTLAKDIEWRIT